MLMWLLRGAFVALMLGIAAFALSFFLSEEVDKPAAGVGVAVGLLLVAVAVGHPGQVVADGEGKADRCRARLEVSRQ